MLENETINHKKIIDKQFIDNSFLDILKFIDNEIDILLRLICSDNNRSKPKISEERIKNYRDKIELGPLLNFSTPWCSNAISILNKCGIYNIKSIELSRFVDEVNYDMLIKTLNKYSKDKLWKVKVMKIIEQLEVKCNIK